MREKEKTALELEDLRSSWTRYYADRALGLEIHSSELETLKIDSVRVGKPKTFNLEVPRFKSTSASNLGSQFKYYSKGKESD